MAPALIAALMLAPALAVLPAALPDDDTPVARYGEVVVSADEVWLDLEVDIDTAWRLALTVLSVEGGSLPEQVLADTWLVVDDVWLRLEALSYRTGTWTRARVRVGAFEQRDEVERAEQILYALAGEFSALRERQAAEQREERERQQALARRDGAIGASSAYGSADAYGRSYGYGGNNGYGYGYASSGYVSPWGITCWVPFDALWWMEWTLWRDGYYGSYGYPRETVAVVWLSDPWHDPWCRHGWPWFGAWGWYDDGHHHDYDHGHGHGHGHDGDDGDDDDDHGGGDDDDDGGDGGGGGLNPRIANWDPGRSTRRPQADGSGGRLGRLGSGGAAPTPVALGSSGRSIVLPSLPKGTPLVVIASSSRGGTSSGGSTGGSTRSLPGSSGSGSGGAYGSGGSGRSGDGGGGGSGGGLGSGGWTRLPEANGGSIARPAPRPSALPSVSRLPTLRSSTPSFGPRGSTSSRAPLGAPSGSSSRSPSAGRSPSGPDLPSLGRSSGGSRIGRPAGAISAPRPSPRPAPTPSASRGTPTPRSSSRPAAPAPSGRGGRSSGRRNP